MQGGEGLTKAAPIAKPDRRFQPVKRGPSPRFAEMVYQCTFQFIEMSFEQNISIFNYNKHNYVPFIRH